MIRLASCIGVAAAAVILAWPNLGAAQTPPPPAATPQNPATAAPAAPTPTPPAPAETEPSDDFGVPTTLTAQTIIYFKGSGTWDKAFETVANGFKKVHAYIDKEGLKTDGLPMTIFTSTDDTGFDFEAAIPITEAPKNPPHGELAVGQSPAGQALKFVHRGSYDALDDTYEAITNYLDEKRIDAADMFIEQYVTDPVSADPNKLVVNVYVLIK